MRVMVSGSRKKWWADTTGVKRAILSRINTFPRDTVLMQGGADGVDSWVEIACEITGHACVPYRPDPSLPSPHRFHERNDRMLRDADEVLVFWDGESPGTDSVITKARRAGLKMWIVELPQFSKREVAG